MGRYVRDEILNQPEDFVQYMMNDFFHFQYNILILNYQNIAQSLE